MLDSNISYKLLLVTTLILLVSCSKTPDVRVTLCQDVTQLLLNSTEQLEWQEHKAIIKGYEDLEIQLQSTSAENNTVQASCFYPYEQDEIGAETFQEPTAAYATYPSKMLLQGKIVDKMLLSKTINQAMLQQGKEAIIKGKETIIKVKEDLKQASQKAMEKLNN